MKVIATNKYEELHLRDSELQRVPTEGETFEISEKRFELLGNAEKNPYRAVFVKKLEEIKEETKEIETAKKEPKTEKAVKKTTKKNK